MFSALKTARSFGSLFVKLAPSASLKTTQSRRGIHIPRVAIPEDLDEALRERFQAHLATEHEEILLPLSPEIIEKESAWLKKYLEQNPSCEDLQLAREDLLSRKADAIFFKNSITPTGSEAEKFRLLLDTKSVGRELWKIKPYDLIEKNGLNLLFIASFLSELYAPTTNQRVPGMSPYNTLFDIYKQPLHTDGITHLDKHDQTERNIEFNCLSAIKASGKVGTLFIGTKDIISELDKKTIEILQKPIFKNHRKKPEPRIRTDHQGHYMIIYDVRSKIDEDLCKKYGVDPQLANIAHEEFEKAVCKTLSTKSEEIYLESGNQFLFRNTIHQKIGIKPNDKTPANVIKKKELRTVIASLFTNTTDSDKETER